VTKRILFAAGMAAVMLTPAAARLGAQAPQAPAAAHASGIFVVLPGATDETQVKGSLAQQKTKGIGKSIITQGFSKPSLEMHVNGAASDVHLASSDVTFYFYFPPPQDNSKTPPPMPDFTAAASMMNNMYSTLPSQAKNGANDFVLLRLQTTDSERVADMGKSPGNKPKDPIPFVAEKTGPLIYKVKTKDSLPPGEYAFTFIGMGSAGGQLWDFAITGK